MTDTTKNANATENNAAEAAAIEKKEMQEAQKSGVVDFSQKKEDKKKSGNYTHTFSKPVEIEGKQYKTLTLTI